MNKLLVTRFEGAKPFGDDLNQIEFDEKRFIDEQLIESLVHMYEVSSVLHQLYGEIFDESLDEKALECYVMLTDHSGHRLYDPKYPIDSLKGFIVIPVNNDDIERIRHSKGHATILDGGYLYIDSLVDPDEFLVGDYTQLKDLFFCG
jgi:hypothetical protein